MTNGLQNEFKVYPVQMVASVSKLSRESSKQHKRQPSPAKNSLFETVLNNAAESMAPADCYAVTYNADSKLQAYFYRQSREYTF